MSLLSIAILIASSSLVPLGYAASAGASAVPVRVYDNDLIVGYAVNSSVPDVSSVQVSFVVPHPACSMTGQTVAFGLAMAASDPAVTSLILAAIQCPGNNSPPVYSVLWGEIGNGGRVYSTQWTPSAGDRLSFRIVYDTRQKELTFVMTDMTQRNTTRGLGNVLSGTPSAAICGAVGTPSGFKVVDFLGCEATVRGLTEPIGQFASILVKLVLVGSNGAVLATPGPLSRMGDFTVLFM